MVVYSHNANACFFVALDAYVSSALELASGAQDAWYAAQFSAVVIGGVQPRHAVDFRLVRRQSNAHAGHYEVSRIKVLRVYAHVSNDYLGRIGGTIRSLSSDEGLTETTVHVVTDSSIHLQLEVGVEGLYIIHFQRHFPYSVIVLRLGDMSPPRNMHASM